MCTWLRVLLLSTLAVAVVPVAQAQEAGQGPPPPHLAFAEGVVELELDGQIEPATPSTALLDGDRVRTRGGRAEIVYADGTVVHLDRDTQIEVMSPTRVRLTEGRLIVRTSAAIPEAFVVDTAAASIELSPRGEYAVRMDERRRDLSFAVARGLADADTWSGRLVVRAGERADVPESGAPRLSAYNSARWDAFDRWSADRVNAFTSAASASHLPYELRAHGPVLDHHGSWGHVAEYGSVWFPRVGPAWRPYFDGRWRQTRYGLTWVGYDPWAWPTHHYGRWGVSGSVWFWIPARVWGPAWVSWAYAPSYVSWAPLGWDGHPVVAFHARFGSHDPWRAWTVLPRQRLGHRGNLRPWIVDGGRLPMHVRSGFQERAIRPARAERFVGSARPERIRGVTSPRPEQRRGARPEQGRGVDPGAPIRSPQRAFESIRSGPNRPPTSGATSRTTGAAPSAERPFDVIRSEANRPGRVRAPGTAGRSQVETPVGTWSERAAAAPRWSGQARPSRSSDSISEPAAPPPAARGEGRRNRSERSAPAWTPSAVRPAGPSTVEGAGPPPDRGGAGRWAMPRAAQGGESGRGGGPSAAPPPSPRGESGARTRPGRVRRPPN